MEKKEKIEKNVRIISIVKEEDETKTYKWIKNRFIKRETERLITAAQDQALPTQ